MRPGQNRRMRGRNNNRKGPNPLTRSYESNGPDVKIRGTAQHIADKYAQLARDAQASGDPVSAENYLQHAEHYYRVIAAAQPQFQPAYGGPPRSYEEAGEDGHDGDDEASGGLGQQPLVGEVGAPQPDIRQSGSADEGGYQPRTPQQGHRNPQNFDRGNGYQRPDGNREGQFRDGQGRRDRFRDDNRRDDNRRFANQPQPNVEDGGPGLPAFLTTPVRQAPGPEGNGAGGGAPGEPESNEGGGHYSMRSRRRRGRGRQFGGGDREGGVSSESGADSDAPTPVE